MASPLWVHFLGTQVPYAVGMAHMRRGITQVDEPVEQGGGSQLFLLEHTDTLTITRQHGATHLLASEEELSRLDIDLVETDRGGDVTFHGKGQLVGYLVMRLSPVDLIGYLRRLEKALLGTCHALGLKHAHLIDGKTGVWVHSRKLIAIGVGVSNGITKHGFAFNLSTDLERFTACMVPCGLKNHGVTRLDRELANMPSDAHIQSTLIHQLSQAFALSPHYPVAKIPKSKNKNTAFSDGVF